LMVRKEEKRKKGRQRGDLLCALHAEHFGLIK